MGTKQTSDQESDFLVPVSPPGFVKQALKLPSQQSSSLKETLWAAVEMPATAAWSACRNRTAHLTLTKASCVRPLQAAQRISCQNHLSLLVLFSGRGMKITSVHDMESAWCPYALCCCILQPGRQCPTAYLHTAGVLPSCVGSYEARRWAMLNFLPFPNSLSSSTNTSLVFKDSSYWSKKHPWRCVYRLPCQQSIWLLSDRQNQVNIKKVRGKTKKIPFDSPGLTCPTRFLDSKISNFFLL